MAENTLQEIKNALMAGDRQAVASLTKRALDEGIAIKDILDNGLIAGMEIIGKKFKASEIFIPEVLISAKAMHAGMDILKPHFLKSGIKPLGTVVIGTVKGDLHDIGKNIVSMMLKGSCFDVHDLGIDVPVEKFVEAAHKEGAQIIAMSSLLTTSMNAMRDTVNALKKAGMSEKVKVMVGGAPITEDFASSIGADGYAKDAASAVDKAKELLKKS
ncbi:MAG: corrinoid protein [Candidatus Omnitrophica bacterium]|nr:corrinoid protein [Candidatus Omnitrophota bacterium]